jgi:tetratricopeptide (TPR) repeat protein
VQAAHELGIMHRDLKPANILLEKPRRSGMTDTSGKNMGMTLVPKVSDFGLAKLSEAESDLSKSAIYLGTPAYMSPEQTLGDSERIDRRADIYSLGVILYEGLTGRLPFVGEDLNDLFSRIRHHAAVPPSAIQAGVPHDLETICLKCLEKDPRARYQTAAQLAEELTCFLEGNPIKARPIGPVGQSFRWAKRKPVLALALILLFVELVAFAAWSRRSAKMGWDERETIKKEADRLRADYVKLRDHYTYGIDLIHDNSSELNRIIERGSNDRELRMFQMKLTRQRGDLAERVISDLIVQDVFGNFLVEAYYLAAIKDMMDRDYDKAIMQYRSAVDRALELSETGKLADKSRYFAMRSVVGLADFAIESDDYIEAVRLLEQSWERFASHGEDYILAKPVKMMSMQTSFRLIQCYEMLGRPDRVREQQSAIDKLVKIPVLEGEGDVDSLY